MLALLEERGELTDDQAKYNGIINPRLEAGLLKHREELPVRIVQQSELKREYKWNGQ